MFILSTRSDNGENTQSIARSLMNFKYQATNEILN